MATTILPTYNYTTSTSDATPTSLPMANAYKYDQLNRIAQSNSFTNFDATSNNWTNIGAIANMYKTSYTYDANGNIKNLQRYNAAGVKFDDMTYKYDEQNGNLISNKLYHVNDAIASGIHTADIDDEGTYNTTNVTTASNYTYDAIGNLTKDVSEQIQNIEWTVSGKIKKIIRTGISTKPDLEYVYDAMGNRIAKIVKPDGSSLENGGADNPTQWTYTYYVRDAQGNIMANYQKSTASSITSFKLIERSIYGSSRLGIDKTNIDLTASTTPPTILNHNLGLKNYELSNHLGNVTTVISDRKIPRAPLGSNTTIAYYMPDIVSATDYYPFGMTMQERTFSAGGVAYRFGFNGKENDTESNTQDYGMRIYDGRLGRFLSIDPLTKQYPELTPYQFASNSPIMAIDLDGEEAKKSTTPKPNLLIVITSDEQIKRSLVNQLQWEHLK
nr:RHS repeat-associated core domain-containing protein [Bacteroidota bacterium]